MKSDPQRRANRRGWAQFRLRSLLLVTLLCGIVLAVVLHCYVEPYRREWRIHRQLLRSPHAVHVAMRPDAPAWLRPFGAERYMQRIVDVEIHGCDDDTLLLIAQLPALMCLKVRSATVTDDGVKQIDRCNHLESLKLDCPRVTDAGLASLSGLSELSWLQLKAPLVTNAGFKNLSNLHELWHLELVTPSVSDEGMTHLSGLALGTLDITASVGDGGLRHLVNRHNLQWVDCLRPGKERVAQSLKEKTEANFQDQPLCDVLEYIGGRHEVTISSVADLKRAGIDPLLPVTIKTPKAPRNRPAPYYQLYDLLNDTLAPLGLDWRMGSTTDLEILPRKALAQQRPNLTKLRASLPQCRIIVDF